MVRVRQRIGSNEGYHASRAILSLLGLVLVTVMGTIGYRLIEDWSWHDSIYMVFLTLSTVGFQEVHPLGPGGQGWTVFLVISGVGTAGFAAANLVEFGLEGHLSGFRRKRVMKKQIEAMKHHYIVCGYGRVGQQVVEELLAQGQDVVVIDLTPRADLLETQGVPVLVGNAQSEDILIEAGVQKARGLISAVDSDTENVFIILTARALRPDLQLIARASDRETKRKLKIVGADRVVSPYVISGTRMAAMAIQPDVVDFLDAFTQPLGDMPLEVASIEIDGESELAGKSLGAAEFRQRCGAMVLAVRHGGATRFNPDADTLLQTGVSLLVLGTSDQLGRLKAMARA